MAMFYSCSVQHGNFWRHVAMEYSNVASETEKLTFYFYVVLMNFHLKSHRWVAVSLLDSTEREPWRRPPREAESTEVCSFWEVGQYEEIEMEPTCFLS